jgi:hypothetical protein
MKGDGIMIRKAMKALADGDSEALAGCFSEDCRYFDYCPSCHGADNYFVYGSAGVEMFFKNRFNLDHLAVYDPIVEDENTASFFGLYDGLYVFARFRIEAWSEAGRIKKAVVHPT